MFFTQRGSQQHKGPFTCLCFSDIPTDICIFGAGVWNRTLQAECSCWFLSLLFENQSYELHHINDLKSEYLCKDAVNSTEDLFLEVYFIHNLCCFGCCTVEVRHILAWFISSAITANLLNMHCIMVPPVLFKDSGDLYVKPTGIMR